MPPVFPEENVTTLGGLGHPVLARSPRVYAVLRALLVPRAGQGS
jgi:hypothetical protein